MTSKQTKDISYDYEKTQILYKIENANLNTEFDFLYKENLVSQEESIIALGFFFCEFENTEEFSKIIENHINKFKPHKLIFYFSDIEVFFNFHIFEKLNNIYELILNPNKYSSYIISLINTNFTKITINKEAFIIQKEIPLSLDIRGNLNLKYLNIILPGNILYNTIKNPNISLSYFTKLNINNNPEVEELYISCFNDESFFNIKDFRNENNFLNNLHIFPKLKKFIYINNRIRFQIKKEDKDIILEKLKNHGLFHVSTLFTDLNEFKIIEFNLDEYEKELLISTNQYRGFGFYVAFFHSHYFGSCRLINREYTDNFIFANKKCICGEPIKYYSLLDYV